MQKLEKIVKKHKLKLDQAIRMIVYHHELERLIPKNKLKRLELNFNGDSYKHVIRVAKALKISEDAVINTLLQDYLNEQERINSDKKI